MDTPGIYADPQFQYVLETTISTVLRLSQSFKILFISDVKSVSDDQGKSFVRELAFL